MNKFKLRIITVIISIIFSAILGADFAQPKTQINYIKYDNILTPASSSSVKIEGYLGDKINLCIENRVMAQNIEKIIRPFRLRNESDFGGFRCEYWGKWFTSAMLAYSYQPTAGHLAVIDTAVNELLATQTQDGYIGTYDKQHSLWGWDIWGQKYTVLGLIAYYDQTKDPKALKAACRMVDLLMTKVGPGKVNIAENGIPLLQGLPSTSILRPIVLLYERTGNRRYLNFSKYIVHQWDVPNKFTSTGLRLIENALTGITPIKIDAPKAYEMMSNFEGLLELYKVTGEKKYLDAGVKFGESLRKYERLIIGSGSDQELWADAVREQTEILPQPVETCVTAVWMRYCYQLLKVTGNPVWADELEVSLYNALLGAMTPNGDWFAYHSPLIGQRVPSHQQHPDVGLSCCVANGPRGLLLTPRWAVMKSKVGLVVNLYAKGSYCEKLSDGTTVKILQTTDYPVNDEIILNVQPAETKRFTIGLRIPGWSKKTQLSVNGYAINCEPGKYAKISRTWKSSDEIILKLDLRGRVIPTPSGAPDLAVMRGPIVLTFDNRLTEPQDTCVWLLTSKDKIAQLDTAVKSSPSGEVNPPVYAGYVRIEPSLLPADGQDYITLKPVKSKPENIWMAFEVSFVVRPWHFFSNHEKILTMCDYASAGNEWNDNNSYRVWFPQPMYMANMYPPPVWRLINPETKTRPVIPPKL
jgi:DUF1680 family protein